MATINFPTNPVVNQIYKFVNALGKTTTYQFLAGQTGASDGYWSGLVNPGAAGPATAAEINAGVEDIKYIAPDQLELSKYNKNIAIVGKKYQKDVGVGITNTSFVVASVSPMTFAASKVGATIVLKASFNTISTSANSQPTRGDFVLYVDGAQVGNTVYTSGTASGEGVRNSLVITHTFTSADTLTHSLELYGKLVTGTNTNSRFITFEFEELS